MGRKANVLFLGSPYWCAYLSRLLNEYECLHAHIWTNSLRWVLSRNKSVCLVGLGPPDTCKRYCYHILAFVMQQLGIVKKRVIYWIGSDVSRLSSDSRFVDGCINVAGSSWLAEEVVDKGYICGERLFPVKLSIVERLPFVDTPRLQILCYVPDAHHQLHGSIEIQWLVERYPKIEFTIIGGVGDWWSEHPENVRFLGWIEDAGDCLRNAHVLLRRTEHDSLSAFVREGLVAGRHVVFTYDVPGVTFVKSGDITKLEATIKKFNEQFSARQLTHNDLDPVARNRLTDTACQLKAFAADYD